MSSGFFRKKEKRPLGDTETQSQLQWPGVPVTAAKGPSRGLWVIHRDLYLRDLYIGGNIQIASSHPWPLRCALLLAQL